MKGTESWCLDFNERGQNQVELRFETPYPTPPRAGGFGSIISVLKAPPGGHVKFCRLAQEVAAGCSG